MANESAVSQFDAAKAAKQIEHLALNRIDTPNTILNYPTDAGLAAARDLGEAWRALDRDQRTAVANELTQKYHNADLTRLPVPTVLTNMNGEMIGVEFDASFYDWRLGPAAVKIIATDGAVIEKRSDRLTSDKRDSYLPEYTVSDPYTGKKN